MKTCSYCLNAGRLPTPPGVIPVASGSHLYFDCPVCQENRVVNEFGETDLEIKDKPEEEPETISDEIAAEFREAFYDEDFEDLEEDDWEDEEDLNEDID